MKTIRISGIIDTWQMENESNVTPEDLNKSLLEANGEDVLILINSPGGSVYAGLEMYSLIRNYKGKTETRVVSMSASMGSIIALAGDKRTAETTASYMIHNASGIGWGDYREMQKTAEYLEAVTGHLSNIYTERTGVDNNKIREMMNAETWKYGEDLKDFGFEIVDSEENIDMSTARFNAHNRYDSYKKELLNHAEEYNSDIEKAVASFGGLKIKPKNQNVQKPQNIKTPENSGKNNNKEIALMTKDEIKAQFPEVYNEIMQEGVSKQQDLVTAHLTMGEAGDCMDLAIKNIKEGNEINHTIQAEYMAEGMKKRDISNREEDNVEDLGAGQDDDEIDVVAQKEYEEKLKARWGKK